MQTCQFYQQISLYKLLKCKQKCFQNLQNIFEIQKLWKGKTTLFPLILQ